jgi:glucose/arabinose dehydrogenase
MHRSKPSAYFLIFDLSPTQMSKNLFLILAFLALKSQAQVVKIQPLCQGLLYPTCIQNSGLANDDRLFVLEKRGRIKIVNRLTGQINPIPFLDIYSRVYPVTSVSDERGLLGLAFHPDYASNGFFYIWYVATNGKNVLARYQVSPFADTAFKYSEQIMLNIFDPYSNHNGGNLMFGPEDEYLYISTGDGGSSGDPGNRAQNKDSLLGKILRLDVSNPSPPYYFPAPGNPFYGATPGRDEIFDWGLRNAWRCSFDRHTHDMWVADVGQNAYEEINFRSHCDTVGHNYGWRCYEGNTAYNTVGCQTQSTYVAPAYVYTHSLGCSVTGGYVYRGGQEGGLYGKYLFTDYCQGRIWSMEPTGGGGFNTTQLVQSTAQINNNFSALGEDIYGELYMAGTASGIIYTLRDTSCAPVARIHGPDTMYVCPNALFPLSAVYGQGLSYNWQLTSSGSWSVISGQGSDNVSILPDQFSTATLVLSVSNTTCAAISKKIILFSQADILLKNGKVMHDTTVCLNDASISLAGTPPKGSFSGPGCSGNSFSPLAAGAGTHTIQYVFADTSSTCNYTASQCLFIATRMVVVELCAGLSEQSPIRNLKIFPNPSQSGFQVSFITAPDLDLELRICDALGRTVFVQNLDETNSERNSFVDLSGCREGLYFLHLKSDRCSKVEKIFLAR